jgi:hypothetical protein
MNVHKRDMMSNQALALRPHDVCVALQLALVPAMPFRDLAQAVGISLGEAHNSAKRLESARLLMVDLREMNLRALLEFIVSGVPYAYPGELGPEVRGVPTAYSGPAMANELDSPHVVVWPSIHGRSRGISLTPLCPSAPETLETNPSLYRLLTLVDALRIGRARERDLARRLLATELGVSDGDRPKG